MKRFGQGDVVDGDDFELRTIVWLRFGLKSV